MSYRLSPTITKTANVKLPTEPSMWVDAIYEHVAQTHPYLAGHLQGDIDWSEEPIDEDRGNGIGHITALVGETPIRIPVIVRDYELYPVDLYVTPEGDMDLIDQDIVIEHFNPHTTQVGNTVDPYLDYFRRYDNDGMYTDWMGKVGSYQSFAEDCERILPDLAEKYPSMSGSITRLQKTAEKVSRPLDDDVLVFQDLGTGYQVSTFNKGHKTASHSISRSDAYANPKSVMAEAARRADKHGSTILVNRSLDKTALRPAEASAAIGDAAGSMSPGETASMVLDNGEQAEGVVMPLVSLDCPETDEENPDMIFLAQTEEGACGYSLSPQALQSGSGKALTSEQVIDLVDAEAGTRGFLALPQPGEQSAGLAGPARVVQVFMNTSGERVVRLDSMVDGNVRLILSDKVQQVFPIEETDGVNRYVVPEDLEMICADEELVPTNRSAEDVLNDKTAATDGLGVASIGENRGSYLCKADGVEESLMRKEAEGWLMSLGCREKSARELLKQAAVESGRISVYGLEDPLYEERGQERVSRETQEKIAQAIETWASHRETLNKFAAQLPNGSMMQSQMASMNMMNQYNASRFADALREIKDAKHAVAKLLYMVRTGEVELIDGDIAKEALTSLDAIIEGLEQVKASR